MKRKLIGQIPLIGCGFYPSKILERIIFLPWISRESPEVIEEDFAFFRRMKIQNFKDGFTWILPNGASFFIQLKCQQVYIYSIEKEESPPPPVLPIEIVDLLAEEWPAVPELSADTETLPDAFDLEDPILPDLPVIAVQAAEISEAPGLDPPLPQAKAIPEAIPGPGAGGQGRQEGN
jgi:hypothetical protein